MKQLKILIALILLISFVACGREAKQGSDRDLKSLSTQAPLAEVSTPAPIDLPEKTTPAPTEAILRATTTARSSADEESSREEGSEGKSEKSEETEQDKTESSASEQDEKTETTSTEKKRKSKSNEPKKAIPDEPKVPLKEVDLDQPTGVSGHLAQQFFDLLALDPVYFNYREWQNDEVKQEMLLLLSRDRVYLKLNRDAEEQIIVKPENSAFYLLDRDSYIALKLPVNAKVTKEISAYAFAQLGKGAAKLVYTGNGEAKFHDHDAVFEEYRSGEDSYVRYYFDQAGLPLGHRLIEDGKVTSDIEILELKNEVEERYFRIPAIYEIVND